MIEVLANQLLRSFAIAKLERFVCEGPATTIPMHLAILRSEAFRSGDYTTRAIPGWPPAAGRM